MAPEGTTPSPVATLAWALLFLSRALSLIPPLSLDDSLWHHHAPIVHHPGLQTPPLPFTLHAQSTTKSHWSYIPSPFYYFLGASCYHHMLGILPQSPLPAQDLSSLSLIFHQVAEQASQIIALGHEEQSRCGGYHPWWLPFAPRMPTNSSVVGPHLFLQTAPVTLTFSISLRLFSCEICHSHLNPFTSSCCLSGCSLDSTLLTEEDSPCTPGHELDAFLVFPEHLELAPSHWDTDHIVKID